jgi:outer membrane receptor protein involved in Fe transport
MGTINLGCGTGRLGAVSFAAAALGLACVSDAFAQQDIKSDQLTEIVVTATRRETTVQNTPISITAVTGADIEARGLSDFNSVAQSVPGIAMLSAGPGQTQYEIRGLPPTGGVSATVGFYLDDTPLTAPAGSLNGFVTIDPNLYDLNRVEILRGPQGTLYGSGSMGGTIRLIPNAPDLAGFDASGESILSGTRGGGFNHAENAMVNLPLGNTAALRIVGSQSHDSGWISRIVIANGDDPVPTDKGTVRGSVAAAPVAADYKGVNDSDLTGVRISLLWKPTEELSITPSYFYQKITLDGTSDIDSNPGTNAHYQPFDIAEPFSDRFNIGSFNVKYHTDWFDVNSTTSYWTRDQFQQLDSSQDLQFAFGFPSFYTSQGGLGAVTTYNYTTSKQTSEEIRLTSSTNSDLNWQVGYFYSDFKSSYNQAILAPGAVPSFGLSNLYTQIEPTQIIQQALFGELSYQLTSQLKATVGLRGYHYGESEVVSLSGFINTGSNAFSTSSASAHDNGVNPKFNLDYQVDENLLLYATIAKGFRPGAGNAPIPTSGPVGTTCEANLQALNGTTSSVTSPLSFGPDSVWSYELGEKMTAFDHRLTVNTAAYYENWSQIQQNVILPCGFAFQANAGTAHIYGSELEINAVLAQGLVLSANAGYTHAEIVSAERDTGLTPGPVQLVPDWTASESLTYRHPVANQLSFMARVENDYVGARPTQTAAPVTLPAYDLTQIRAGVDGAHWSAVLFAKNVFNVRPELGAGYGATVVFYPAYNRLTVGQPLTVGVDLNYHFGR